MKIVVVENGEDMYQPLGVVGGPGERNQLKQLVKEYMDKGDGNDVAPTTIVVYSQDESGLFREREDIKLEKFYS